MSDWTPREPGSKLLKRHFSYIKPLNGGIGPKQTKCEISDEIDHMDPDKFVSVITTTRTPDVPSGNVFSVKTRTCLVWASARTTKVLVTTKVEWTGRSFIKGRSCVVMSRRVQLTPARIFVDNRYHRKVSGRWPKDVSSRSRDGHATVHQGARQRIQSRR